MKEIIPFKKNILFKGHVHEVTEISLKHDYNVKENSIEGKFLLVGAYKLTEASVIEEDFNFDIPFSINISDSIDRNTVNLLIDNFNYNLNNNSIDLNIDLSLEAEELIIEEEQRIENIEFNNEININKEENNIKNIINSFNEENYSTYKVYFIKNNDTFESISNKYNVSVDLLKEINNIKELNEKNKIIIPLINE